jgi:hypothetical protein
VEIAYVSGYRSLLSSHFLWISPSESHMLCRLREVRRDEANIEPFPHDVLSCNMAQHQIRQHRCVNLFADTVSGAQIDSRLVASEQAIESALCWVARDSAFLLYLYVS